MLPMALCADAVAKDGKLVGDPTEGALVVLAAKGGVDPTLTREQYPRLAEVPFDAAYKLMATFHAMKDDAGKDVVRCYVKGAPDQLFARATAATTGPMAQVPVAQFTRRVLRGERAARRAGTAGHGDRHAGLRPGVVRRQRATSCRSSSDITLLAMVGIVDPPRPEAKDAIASAKRPASGSG